MILSLNDAWEELVKLEFMITAPTGAFATSI